MAKNVFIKKTSRGKLQTWTWQCGGKLHFSSCGSISRRLYVCMDVCMYSHGTKVIGPWRNKDDNNTKSEKLKCNR